MTNKGLVSLSSCATGSVVELAQIDAGRGLQSRLSAMGLLPGVIVRVISNGHPGPFILEIKGTRLALGRGMVSKVLVKQTKG